MRTIALILALAFASMAGLGFMAMSHASDHSGSNCLASLLDSADCPRSVLSAAAHHMSAYRSLSNGRVTLIFAELALMLAAALVALWWLRASYRPEPSLALIRIDYRPAHPGGDRKTARWLSLFEHSPSE